MRNSRYGIRASLAATSHVFKDFSISYNIDRNAPRIDRRAAEEAQTLSQGRKRRQAELGQRSSTVDPKRTAGATESAEAREGFAEVDVDSVEGDGNEFAEIPGCEKP